jgi:hypothetical protein
MIVVSSLFT